MYALLLQDWITLAGPDPTPMIQNENDWLDMSPYQDVVVWLEVNGTLTAPSTPADLAIETSPSKDDALFQPMTSATSMVMGVTVFQLLMGSTAVPVAQFLRWKITGVSTPWHSTFRILLAANAPGLQLPEPSPLLLSREI